MPDEVLDFDQDDPGEHDPAELRLAEPDPRSREMLENALRLREEAERGPAPNPTLEMVPVESGLQNLADALVDALAKKLPPLSPASRTPPPPPSPRLTVDLDCKKITLVCQVPSSCQASK